MSWTKLLAINFLVTISLIILLEVSLKFVFYLRDTSRESELISKIEKSPNITADTRGFNAEYSDFTTYSFKAFVGWVSPNFKGNYLNVDNLRRKTIEAKKFKHHLNVHLFGGSTMWGHSVSDKNTIPSILSQNALIRAINYGEQAYNSRQAFNLLIENIKQINRGDIVIFYDGVNDVYNNCSADNSWNGYAREGQIRRALEGDKFYDFVENLSIFRLLNGINKRLTDTPELGGPCTNVNRASKVADFLVNSWYAASLLLESKDVKFLCVLQPNPYTFNGKVDLHNNKISELMTAVYPIIQAKASELPCFYDMSRDLKSDNYVDDCCHMNEHGNKEVADLLKLKIDDFLMP